MENNQRCELCIVMPAYNEEGCIREVVRSWLQTLGDLDVVGGRLVVVNDGSRDETGDILDQLGAENQALRVVHQKNGGHGRALRNAYEQALLLQPEWVFHVDSDDQFNNDDLRLLWNERTRSKFLIGYRKKRHDAMHRLVITRILRLVGFLFFGAWLRDSNIPFRLIEGRYLKALLEQVPPTVFAPNIFLAVLARRDGQDLMEIPVEHRDRRTGKVSIVRWRLIKACLRCVRELFEFRLALGGKLRSLRALSIAQR